MSDRWESVSQIFPWMLWIQWDLHKISVSPITQFLKCISSVWESNKKISWTQWLTIKENIQQHHSQQSIHQWKSVLAIIQLLYIHSKVVTGASLPKDKVSLHIWSLGKNNKITLKKPPNLFYLLSTTSTVFILVGSRGSWLSHNSLLCQWA